MKTTLTALRFMLLFGAFATVARAQTYTVLHTFTAAEGVEPQTDLVRDRVGNLYGTLKYSANDTLCCGAVFKLDVGGTLTLLHSFAGPPDDGEYPYAGLGTDNSGNLVGTAEGGASMAAESFSG